MEVEEETTRVSAVGEWVDARIDGEHIEIEMGYEGTEDHEWHLRLTPEAAVEFALRLIDQAYTARGVEIKRIGILINPEMEVVDQVPEEMPS